MAKKPFFSIIIPALNEARYLPKLLADLVAQSYRDFEVIVVDGRSDDQTVSKAKEFSKLLPSLKIITSAKRHVSTQRNLGASVAKADVFIFSDADNRLPSHFLQGIKYRWEAEKKDILSPYMEPDKPNNKIFATTINLFLELQMSIKPSFMLESLVVIGRECFETVGGFDESRSYNEGTVFVEKAHKLKYLAKVVKDPMYTFSFRRLKKYGSAKVVSGVVRAQLMELLGIGQNAKLYPMLGGSVYHTRYGVQKNKTAKFLKNIQKILKEL